jgi:hypothetical protein
VEDVAAGQPEPALQIERRQYLHLVHNGVDIGRVLGDQIEHVPPIRFPQLVPIALAQGVGRVL